MHARQKLVHARIAKELAAKLAIKKRNTADRQGDTVKVMSGGSKGKSGKVSSVSLRSGIILIEGIVRKNAKGKELPIPIRPSNVYITDLDLSDKLRARNSTSQGSLPRRRRRLRRRRCGHVEQRKR